MADGMGGDLRVRFRILMEEGQVTDVLYALKEVGADLVWDEGEWHRDAGAYDYLVSGTVPGSAKAYGFRRAATRGGGRRKEVRVRSNPWGITGDTSVVRLMEWLSSPAHRDSDLMGILEVGGWHNTRYNGYREDWGPIGRATYYRLKKRWAEAAARDGSDGYVPRPDGDTPSRRNYTTISGWRADLDGPIPDGPGGGEAGE